MAVLYTQLLLYFAHMDYELKANPPQNTFAVIKGMSKKLKYL